MAIFVPIQSYITIAKVCQYLSANDKNNVQFLEGRSLSPKLSRLLYIVRSGIENRFAINPTDESLNETALYLYSLCGKYAMEAQNIINGASQTKPTVTGPSNVSIAPGANATFTISVTSSIAYTIQWYRNGNPIPGATSLSYTLMNAQLSDNGSQFIALVTNAAGSTYSAIGILTVAVSLAGKAWYGDTDPYPYLERGIDNLTYQVDFAITNLSPMVINFPSGAAPNKYIVVRYPKSQLFKNAWNNTTLNYGNIPDPVFGNIQLIGDYYYVVTRLNTPMTLDTTSPLTLSGNASPSPFAFQTQPQNISVPAGQQFSLTAKVRFGYANYTFLWKNSANQTVNSVTNNPQDTMLWTDTVTKTWNVTVTDDAGTVIVSNTITVTIT